MGLKKIHIWLNKNNHCKFSVYIVVLNTNLKFSRNKFLGKSRFFKWKIVNDEWSGIKTLGRALRLQNTDRYSGVF